MVSTELAKAPSICKLDSWPWIFFSGLGLIALCLILAIHHIKKHRRQSFSLKSHPDPWSEVSQMEKAKPSSNSTPPSPSACDVLKPLSGDSGLPSSGEIAAKVREQGDQPGKEVGTTGSPKVTEANSISHSGSRTEVPSSVQKRSESVQQMHEIDADGVRTWKRVIVEYS